MKMVKSLLLGSAGVLAVTAAQAADLPVKAKPVEYVKVCSLYGAGFYYIPGTDTCLKLGGYVRSEWLHNAAGSFAPFNNAVTAASGASSLFTLSNTNDLISRTRGVVSLDARSQTEYGTLRSYFKYGIQWTTGDVTSAGSAAVAYYERAFIQFAGFTFGSAQSFFDFFAYPVYSYQTSLIGSDTGGQGVNLLAYTAQLGNGVTATVSFEDKFRRTKAIVDSGAAATAMPAFNAITGVTFLTTDNAPSGQSFPDIVAALRVDQQWGSAQISGVAHQISPGYYQSGGQFQACTANTTACGHPDREWGWAALAGLELNLPTGPGDKFAIAATWTSGASGYAVTTGVFNFSAYGTGGANGTSIGSVAYVPIADGIYSSAVGSDAQIQTVDAWSVYAGIKHGWSPNLFSTLYGGYVETSWDSGAANVYCTGTTNPTAAQLTAVTGCDPDGSYYQIGSLTQWTPVSNFTVGLDIMYTKMQTSGINNQGGGAATANLANLATVGARQGGVYRVEDVDFWTGILRFQRNFWP